MLTKLICKIRKLSLVSFFWIFLMRDRLPGKEDDDGVVAFSMDERIVKLRAAAERKELISFKLEGQRVSPLSGELRR